MMCCISISERKSVYCQRVDIQAIADISLLRLHRLHKGNNMSEVIYKDIRSRLMILHDINSDSGAPVLAKESRK